MMAFGAEHSAANWLKRPVQSDGGELGSRAAVEAMRLSAD